jgi:uncharacterized protein DUF6790
MHTDSSRLLRKALLMDGLVSGVSGLILLVAPGAVAAFIGAPSSGLVVAVGVVLLVFGLLVVLSARRDPPRRVAAVILALNVAWLLGTVVVVAEGGLSRQGNWALLLVGDVVLVFAALEAIGLRKTASLATAPR